MCRLPTNWLIPTGYKGCCASDPSENFEMTTDVVNGVTKPVLALKAFNADGPSCTSHTADGTCRKTVTSAGGLITADIYASASYSVVAKVPQASGMIWAVWTYHYEEHFPGDCSKYTCFCGTWGAQGCPGGKCMPDNMYEEDGCPAGNGCAYVNFCKDPVRLPVRSRSY